MPELPEVETIAATLRPKISGLRISRIRLLLPKLLRQSDPGALRAYEGASILGVRRRGKMLLISCSGDLHLLFHLKMTGRFNWVEARAEDDPHARLRIAFHGGRGPGLARGSNPAVLARGFKATGEWRAEGSSLDGRARHLEFRDIRKFGFVRCLKTPQPLNCAELNALGPEPLDTDLEEFTRILRGRTGRMKSLLLNQSWLAGIGNIYADEILFASRLHPLRTAASLRPPDIRRLWSSMRTILAEAIAAGGSSIRDYKDADGLGGRFQLAHQVYGRDGEPCRRCATKILRRVIGGRSSFFCPRCQDARAGARPKRSKARLN